MDTAAATAFLEKLAASTLDDPLLTLMEGHFQVQCMRLLNSMGCTLQLSTTASGESLYWRGNTFFQGERRHRIEDGSGDITVVEPTEFCVELKCWPDIGSKAQAAFSAAAGDLDRVAQDRSVIAIQAFESGAYTSYEGMRLERKPSELKDDIVRFYMARSDLTCGQAQTVRRDWRGTGLDAVFLKVLLPTGAERMHVAVTRPPEGDPSLG